MKLFNNIRVTSFKGSINAYNKFIQKYTNGDASYVCSTLDKILFKCIFVQSDNFGINKICN